MKFATRQSHNRLVRDRGTKAKQRKRQSLASMRRTIWQVLSAALIKPPELQVWCTTDRQGKLWWNAYDPNTGRSLIQVSEEQMRVWLEQRHLY